LIATTLAVVLIGALLPLTPLAHALGFVVPPLRFGAFVAAATLAYLALVQVAKVALFRRLAS
jgi:Mg2+-importing ATPase